MTHGANFLVSDDPMEYRRRATMSMYEPPSKINDSQRNRNSFVPNTGGNGLFKDGDDGDDDINAMMMQDEGIFQREGSINIPKFVLDAPASWLDDDDDDQLQYDSEDLDNDCFTQY